jgi:hypothetical protein
MHSREQGVFMGVLLSDKVPFWHLETGGSAAPSLVISKSPAVGALLFM